ncbi:hypothetical protein TELCIR_12887 [Teladorsagia circumcincta]|uniref:Glycoside hydrolase family 19 catalytic domain-containing protein n=1 Tax=Teladorsagia circumcincta TaxID=45464 RepID=A0A2G9U5D7_TELCI|nr:hypothetical protein TELCIR_12887 [Teladorsagia circumcincta]
MKEKEYVSINVKRTASAAALGGRIGTMYLGDSIIEYRTSSHGGGTEIRPPEARRNEEELLAQPGCLPRSDKTGLITSMFVAELLVLLLCFGSFAPLIAEESQNSASGVLPRSQCPNAGRYGQGPPPNCTQPTDPNNLPPSQLEQWFTKDTFEDLFPFANLGWGSNPCLPYSYEAFVIAARYFPNFGTSSPNSVYNSTENARRDLAAFFAHAVQETGENNAGLYE